MTGKELFHIVGSQLRAARAILRITQAELAALAGVPQSFIRRIERSPEPVIAEVERLHSLVRALDEAGVELINAGSSSKSGGPGVRLRTETPGVDGLAPGGARAVGAGPLPPLTLVD